MDEYTVYREACRKHELYDEKIRALDAKIIKLQQKINKYTYKISRMKGKKRTSPIPYYDDGM